jgi:hypothetical protein
MQTLLAPHVSTSRAHGERFQALANAKSKGIFQKGIVFEGDASHARWQTRSSCTARLAHNRPAIEEDQEFSIPRLQSSKGGGSTSAPELEKQRSNSVASNGACKKSAVVDTQCRDLKGRWHSVKQLRERRNAAVMKGMQWMRRFLTVNSMEAMIDIGDDAACLFFEIWYTSSSSTIRSAAKGIAQEMLEKYECHLLEPSRCKCKQCHPDPAKRIDLDDKELFITLMYLIRCKEEMGLNSDAMGCKTDELWKKCGLSNTDELFSVTPEGLADVSSANWVVLLMNIMVMEFNQLLFRRRWPLRWGLREAFEHLRTRQFWGPPYNSDYNFHNSFYLVTHIAFAISAYSAIKTNPKDAPWLFDYNRRSCTYWVQQAWRRLSGKQADRLVDIDGLSEAVDVMRGCGLTDGGDPLLCSATVALLELQRSDGSWPFWTLDDNQLGLVAEAPKEASFYSRLHPTWVAVQSLRDRNFEYDRKGNVAWGHYMERLLKHTNLCKLEHRIIYGCSTKRSSKNPRKRPPSRIKVNTPLPLLASQANDGALHEETFEAAEVPQMCSPLSNSCDVFTAS